MPKNVLIPYDLFINILLNLNQKHKELIKPIMGAVSLLKIYSFRTKID